MTTRLDYDEHEGWFNAFKFLLASPLLDDHSKRQVDIARAEWFKSVQKPHVATNPATLLATDQLSHTCEAECQ
jgi:hypothetical protein